MIFVKFSNFSEESLHVTFVTGGFLFYFFIILFILVCKTWFVSLCFWISIFFCFQIANCKFSNSNSNCIFFKVD